MPLIMIKYIVIFCKKYRLLKNKFTMFSPKNIVSF